MGMEARVSMKICTRKVVLKCPEGTLGLIAQGNQVKRGRGMSTRMNR